MLKIFSLAKNLIKPLSLTSPSIVSFQFHTLKTGIASTSQLKIKQLSFKPQNYVHSKTKKPNETPFKNWRIIKGDKVIVISGKDKGKQGVVWRVYRKQNKVLVSGINIKMKRVKSDVQREIKGGIRPIMHPIHISKVSLIDPESGKATRTRFGYLADGKKIRISKKSGAVIERPESPGWQQKVRNKKKIDGLADTPPNLATEVTYKGENFDRIKKDFEEYIQKKEKREKLLVFDE